MIRSVAYCFSLAYTLVAVHAHADTVQFFDASQIATLVAEGVTSDAIVSRGYQFTYTRDKLFTGGTGQVIGRSVRVPWPDGVEAQSVTTAPPGGTTEKARIVLERADGQTFDLPAFTAKLLANTSGAGADIEIMPLLNGEDAFNDPLAFRATGYYGQTFSYDTTTVLTGSTALLQGFERYNITLYVDFALTALTLEGPPVPGVAGDYNGDGTVNAADYTVWRDHLGATGLTPYELADGTGDGNITAADYDVWNSQFGLTMAATAVSPSATVPEPCSAVLMLTAICLSFRKHS